MLVRVLDEKTGRMEIVTWRGEYLELEAGMTGVRAELHCDRCLRFASEMWETAYDAVVDVVVRSERK